MAMTTEKTIVLTAGDPWSVTTEAWVRLFFGPAAPFAAILNSGRVRLVLCGSEALIRRQMAHLGCQLPSSIQIVDDGIPVDRDSLYPVDPAKRGEHAVMALQNAVKEVVGQKPDLVAVITGPIDKKSCSLAGFTFPGQTEFFEARWGGRSTEAHSSALMVLAGPKLKVGLVTRHVALRDVSGILTAEKISTAILILADTLRRTFGIRAPRIAVCGLNPHAGDQGLFGDEEFRIIEPAIAAARAQLGENTAVVTGPHSADTVFHAAWSGTYDAVLAMYHDQGLAPLKALHFHEAINLSAGLSYLRVSPDHGPAADLFMTGLANPGSFQAAIRVALLHLGEQI